MPIRLLSDTTINQIAAGEVIERPASVAKELIENAIDSGASRIEVAISGGGLTLLRVTDDGCGIPVNELELAVSRHCTSKLGEDIHDIRTLGFRGEALPSIGSVARLLLRSRCEAGDAFEIRVEGGEVAQVRPASGQRGTIAEVRDLFFATPARLKFMKGERAETSAILDVVKRLAIACPGIAFGFSAPDRARIVYQAVPSRTERVAHVLGGDFQENSIALDAGREGRTPCRGRFRSRLTRAPMRCSSTSSSTGGRCATA